MYENNNNYTYTANYSPEEPQPPKKGGKAGRIAAFILAVALVGGASGFGGAFLANSMIANNEVRNVSLDTNENSAEERGTIQTVTAAPQNDHGSDDVSIGNLLNVDSSNSSGELTTQEIIRRATPSVVLITSEFKNYGTGTGTGIVLSSDGYIITNWHVIETTTEELVSNGYSNPFSWFGGGYEVKTVVLKADKVTITLSDGTEHEAKVIGSDESADLALLKIDMTGLTPAVIGNSDDLVLGETAVTLGYPMSLGLSASSGIISGLDKEITTELSNGKTATMTLIQTDASINHGNSGGPLFNSKGEVVGITSAKIVKNDGEGMGLAIPITDAMPILDDLMNKGYVSTPKIGITGTNISASVQRYYNLPVSNGVLVAAVEAGSCAENAGIAEGDIIVAADGKEIKDMDALIAAKNKHKPGETMTVTLARSNGNIDIEIILDEDDKSDE